MLPPTRDALIYPLLQHHLNSISKLDNEGRISCPIAWFSCIITYYSEMEPTMSYKKVCVHIQLAVLRECEQSLNQKASVEKEIY